ncbi:ATP-binding protein [Desertibacillus haloalkaliphilus]|uniref:ATP-binding protein n=1 Tax=Desertibacillus haloalkaliphilus TaxID=1328930 RepID=UPI001C257187|nr:ATP-binding protein [Desertibacillus haloalkaliphilus]MBU8906868.1 ATP-binding protein [Desertibacillus haloalkaliphilus]
MQKLKKITINNEQDILITVTAVRSMLARCSFSAVDEQKILVSISELTRNIIDHANGKGWFLCEVISHGIKIVVKDCGPGIGNLEEILVGKKRTQPKGLGLGLRGVKTLMDEFHIEKNEKGGTTILAIKWESCTSTSR